MAMTPFRSALVAADFSNRSRDAFRVAVSLAEEARTRLHVLHVVEHAPVVEQAVALGEGGAVIPLPAAGTAHHDALKERLREAYVPGRPVDIEYLVRDGAAAEQILAAAAELGADLIVVGSHGRTGLSRVLAGSVSEAVLRRATCPVLALHAAPERPPASDEPRVILHPTDFSDRSADAFRVARALARDHGARLFLFYAVPVEYPVEGGLYIPADPRTYLEPLAALKEQADGPDMKHPVETRCVKGNPADEIVRLAEEIGSDLIVMGTHGRTGLSRLLMGSVAEAVLRRAACPTLIVKAPAIEPAAAAPGPGGPPPVMVP
jgi:nucleotide-binding universal stress UspA family protein